MAAGSNFHRSEVFDVLSKTLQNLRFSSDESRTNDCNKGFLDIVGVSEKQTVGKWLKVKNRFLFELTQIVLKYDCFVNFEVSLYW